MKTILTETFTPIPCPVDVVPKFVAAYNPDASKLHIDYSYVDAVSHTDMYKRMAMFNMNGTQQPRYMGMYGSASEGKIWYDNINGIQDWQGATDKKVAEMLAIENGWSILSSFTETASAINVKVTGLAPKQTKCNLIVLLADEHNKFKQLFVKQVTVPVIKKTLNVSFVPVSTGLRAIVLFQSLTPYIQDGDWGTYEREIFCVTESVKK